MSQVATAQSAIPKKMNFVKTIIRAVLLPLFVVSFAGTIASPAQEPAATPQKQQAEHSPKRRNPGEQLAHETRAATGEEKDETAEFKQSAAVQWIAQKTGLSRQHAYLLCVLLNFAVMGGVLFWASR